MAKIKFSVTLDKLDKIQKKVDELNGQMYPQNSPSDLQEGPAEMQDGPAYLYKNLETAKKALKNPNVEKAIKHVRSEIKKALK